VYECADLALDAMVQHGYGIDLTAAEPANRLERDALGAIEKNVSEGHPANVLGQYHREVKPASHPRRFHRAHEQHPVYVNRVGAREDVFQRASQRDWIEKRVGYTIFLKNIHRRHANPGLDSFSMNTRWDSGIASNHRG
jgi:hypothetical protein